MEIYCTDRHRRSVHLTVLFHGKLSNFTYLNVSAILAVMLDVSFPLGLHRTMVSGLLFPEGLIQRKLVGGP